MKKVISIILSLIMIAAVFAVPVSAEDTAVIPVAECVCEDHIADGDCVCCLYCENLNLKYVTSCAEKLEDGTYSVCCTKCDGVFPCDCVCACCDKDAEDTPDNNGNTPILTPDQQEEVIDSFQSVMQKIVEFFNEFFNYIFEFLKFTDIMGGGESAEQPTE